MGASELAIVIKIIAEFFTWLVIANALLSYFLSPYHPVREALGRIVEPFLNPIRQILPSTGMVDFSPLVLILAVQLIANILINSLR